MKIAFSAILLFIVSSRLSSSTFVDSSIRSYQAERTCGYNEICKEEFRKIFRCKCPSFTTCRSHGKYYNGYCSITDTGYIWEQSAYEIPRTP